MGSDSSSTTSSYRYSIDENLICESADIYVKSRRVKAVFGVHHFIVCDIPNYDKWIVLEWMDDGRQYYACKSLNSNAHTCMYLGNFKLYDVVYAAKMASKGRSYSSDYNCNNWTEKVASYLGYNITAHWNCTCVL